MSDLELLTSASTTDLLGAAVGAEGGQLESWSARQVDHRPGASTTVSYRARVRWSDGVRTETLAARVGPDPTPDSPGVVRVSNGDHEVAVWRYPVDPWLPGLPAATDPDVLAELLRSFGLEGGGIVLRTLSYRPGRRAVIHVGTPSGALVVKAVRPSKIAALHARHRMLAAAELPVPASLGWTDDGLLVMPHLPGQRLRDVLRAGTVDLPTGAAMLALLDALPAEVLALPRRPGWSAHADHYAVVLGAALPSERDRAAQLAGAIGRAVCGAPVPDEPTHGDLYESQLLVRGGQITGLLDVDTVGPGSRVDDLACALAHLAVLTLVWADAAPTIRGLGALWLSSFEREVDPSDLRSRVAGVLLSLATGPHRVQEFGWQIATVRRLDLVEQWTSSATGPPRRASPFDHSPGLMSELSRTSPGDLISQPESDHEAAPTGARIGASR